MTSIVTSIVNTARPKGRRPAPANDLSIRYLALWNSTQVTPDLCTGKMPTASGTAWKISPNIGGMAMGSAGTATQVGFVDTGITTAALQADGNKQRTLFAYVLLRQGGAVDSCVMQIGSSAGQDFSLYWRGNGTWRQNIFGVVATDFTYLPPNYPVAVTITWDGQKAQTWINGALMATTTQSSLNTLGTANLRIGTASNTTGTLNDFVFAGLASRAWTVAERIAFAANPWMVFKAPRPRIWKKTAAVTSIVGGDTSSLKALTETAGAKIGSVSGAVETLKAITESAAGQIPNQGFASETLKALTETAGSQIGSVSGASETLKALTESATGQTTTNNLTGGSTDTLKALAETAGAQIGSVGSAADVLKAITAQATGFTPTQLQQAPTAGGYAWWGYEGFDGSNKPWWYKDLKDKAKELERLKKLRIDLGILPKEVKKITKLIDEIDEFVEETPTPATANYYIAKQEELAERIEKLVDQMEEEEDEKAVMNMSKFFFHHNSRLYS